VGALTVSSLLLQILHIFAADSQFSKLSIFLINQSTSLLGCLLTLVPLNCSHDILCVKVLPPFLFVAFAPNRDSAKSVNSTFIPLLVCYVFLVLYFNFHGRRMGRWILHRAYHCSPSFLQSLHIQFPQLLCFLFLWCHGGQPFPTAYLPLISSATFLQHLCPVPQFLLLSFFFTLAPGQDVLIEARHNPGYVATPFKTFRSLSWVVVAPPFYGLCC
jgi:hypothetical protein